MQFTITRKTGIIGFITSLSVYINNKKVGSLRNGETKEFTFPEEFCEVRVGQGYVKSKPLMIKTGTKLVAKASLFGIYFPLFSRNAFYLEEIQ